jgi:hypothetical protein
MAAFPKTSPTEVKTASMLATRHSGLQKLAMTLHDFGNTPIADNRADHSHRITPSDGEVVWFCHECHNGPMGGWYTSCPICSHQCCGFCTVEEN